MIRIVIADDHTIVRAGFQRLLECEPDIEVVGECGTGREALQLCKKHKATLLLLDLEMPDMDGFEVVEYVRARKMLLKLLVLTMHNHEEYMVRLFQAGIHGFLVKDAAPAELARAIRHVASGKRYIDPDCMESLTMRLLDTRSAGDISQLSNRELQVMTLIARGGTVASIAEDLNLSMNTVATYKSRAMGKLELRDSGDIVRFAIKHGLINRF